MGTFFVHRSIVPKCLVEDPIGHQSYRDHHVQNYVLLARASSNISGINPTRGLSAARKTLSDKVDSDGALATDHWGAGALDEDSRAN